MELDEISLYRILDGSAFLGSGGGGMISSGKTFIKEIVSSGKKVQLITEDMLEEKGDLLSCIVCDIGSITAFDPNQSGALKLAFEMLGVHFEDLGKIEALFPIETGPENTLAAFVLAAYFGIPVIDGDGAGRAVPTIPLCTFSVLNVPHWKPVCIANGSGDSMLVFTSEKEKFDTLLRSVANLEAFQKSGSLALWPDKVKNLFSKCIPGTITNALFVGQILEGIREGNKGLVSKSLQIVNKLEGYLIAKGEVVYKKEKEENGYSFMETRIWDTITKQEITILSQNESLIIYDKEMTASCVAPDSICFLNTDFKARTNAEVKQTANRIVNDGNGTPEPKELFVIGVKAHEKLKHPKILEGFEKIILELNFKGQISNSVDKSQPLGDLLLELHRQYKPSIKEA